VTAADYTTTAALKARLGITDSTDDSILAAIITAVSRQIDDYCGRRFYAATETRYYTARCADHVLVDDLLSVSANGLATDDGTRTYPDVWATTDYDLAPANAALESQPQPYWEVRLTPTGSFLFWPGLERGLRLTGSFGFSSTTPAVVSEACLAQCELTYRASRTPGGRTGSLNFDESLPGPALNVGLHPFVRRLLSPLRRLAVG
jgi:hypothetical protein